MARPTVDRSALAHGRADPRTPNLFIIGAPKAGTTFLHHALGLVPGVFMSSVKEPGYFTSDRDQRRGVGYYLDAFFARAASSAIRGESTPWYLYSERALERIAALPSASPPRFVVMVRRPSARARSMYLDQVRLNREARTFDDAVGQEAADLAEGRLVADVRQRYVWGSTYSPHIRRWQAAFGSERVHVIVLEELVADPDRAWTDLERFLDHPLGPSRLDDVDERDRNRGGSLRWPRVDAFLRSFEGGERPVVEAAKRVLPPGLHRRVLQRLGRLNRTLTHDPEAGPDAATLAWVDEQLLPEVDAMEALLGRALPTWRTGDDAAAGAPGPTATAPSSIRILHLVARSHRRGAELVAVELAEELDARGHDNRIVALGPALGGGREDGLDPLVGTVGVGPLDLVARVRSVRRLLADDPVDVVLAHGGWAAQVAALAAGRNGPLLVWQRILGFPPTVWGPLRRRWWRHIAGRFDVGVALTDDLEQELRRLDFSGPVWVIPNSRQPDRFIAVDRADAGVRLRRAVGAAEDVPLIGFVGHLVAQKRPDRAIDVVDELRRAGQAVHLVVAGDGPLRGDLERQVQRLDLGGAVTFLGHRPDVEHVLGGVELALLTSEAEGIPGVAIEAVMAGCPLVTVPVGGVAEVIDDGVTGLVLEGDDPALLAAAVGDLLAHPVRRAAMSEAGRRRASAFTASATAAVYAERLNAVLAAR